MSAFVFLRGDDETAGERMARCAREACAAGPMGAYLRRDNYVAFLEVWGRAAELSRVRTSCAVFASAVKGHCGGPLTTPWHADGSWGITSWLALRFSKPAWVPWAGSGEPAPPVGAILYWGSKTGSNGHVGVVVERLPSGLYRTAEGGGSPTAADVATMRAAGATATQIAATNGTVCRLSAPKSVAISAGRRLAGWWDPRHMGIPVTQADKQIELRDTEPAPPPHSEPAPAFLPLRRNMLGDDVKVWQRRLKAAGYDLPLSYRRTGDADGSFGDETERQTKACQRDNLLPQTGVVDRATWEHAEARR
ncbi:MAG: hypothetical protein AMXMBFR56_77120 [Polyangiaceae bacterium]